MSSPLRAQHVGNDLRLDLDLFKDLKSAVATRDTLCNDTDWGRHNPPSVFVTPSLCRALGLCLAHLKSNSRSRAQR